MLTPHLTGLLSNNAHYIHFFEMNVSDQNSGIKSRIDIDNTSAETESDQGGFVTITKP